MRFSLLYGLAGLARKRFVVGNRDYVSNLIDFNDSAPSLRLVSLVIIRVIAGYTAFEYIFRVTLDDRKKINEAEK